MSNLICYILGYIYTKIGACIIICKIFQLTTWAIYVSLILATKTRNP